MFLHHSARTSLRVRKDEAIHRTLCGNSQKFLYVLFMQEKSYTYILFNKPHGTLYTGVTSNLIKRMQEHKSLTSGFTAKYNVTQLGYFEEHTSVVDAIEREKKIKAGSRKKKIALIESMNPRWSDLFDLLN